MIMLILGLIHSCIYFLASIVGWVFMVISYVCIVGILVVVIVMLGLIVADEIHDLLSKEKRIGK